VITVAGKSVLTTMEELVDPSRAALLIVDMQRDFCLPGGAFDNYGIDLSMYPPMVGRLRLLLDGARATGVRVIHIQMTVLPERVSESGPQIRFNMRLHQGRHQAAEPLLYTVKGTPGHDFVAELAPQPGEAIVQKYRSSAFWGTNLDQLLRSNGVESVIVTGCTTEGCVESTARDAQFSDRYVVIPEDAVASDDRSQHEASLHLMRHRFDMTTSDEILGIWKDLATKE